MGLNGLFMPTWVGFCTLGKRPIIKGPSFVGILGVHYRFGHL
jgi:hypothetical protein